MERNSALQESLRDWFKQGSSPEKIARTLFIVSNGDGRKLLSSYTDPEGIYGSAASLLFEENTQIHRYLLRNVWIANKRGVRVSNFCLLFPELSSQRNDFPGNDARSLSIILHK